jgi:hypothetical protein
MNIRLKVCFAAELNEAFSHVFSAFACDLHVYCFSHPKRHAKSLQLDSTVDYWNPFPTLFLKELLSLQCGLLFSGFLNKCSDRRVYLISIRSPSSGHLILLE